MARYDRIARLPCPAREDAYTGWLALRDLEGRERDRDLARRARLRFLAVRLVHRLTASGDAIDLDSLHQQRTALREELGLLPARDPERQRLAEFLERFEDPDAAAVAQAAFDMAAGHRADGYPFAAEEFYLAGTELADASGLDGLRAEGLRQLNGLDAGRRGGPTS